MTGSIEHSRRAWALARRQHWVITRTQLLDLGFTDKAIEWRVREGRLHVTWRGVYAVGRPELTRHGWLMAAVLACGEGAVLSHDSAAELWDIRIPRNQLIHVSVTRSSPVRRRGIQTYRRPSLAAEDVATQHGIPTTTPTRTLMDLTLHPRELEAAVNEADKLDLIDPESLREALEASAGQPGVKSLRKLLDRHTLLLTDSELERRFVPIANRAGLPPPQTQASLHGFRVDFYWPTLDLVVETDGLRYHRTPTQQARDRVRDQALTAAGLTVLRFTHAQVRYEPGYVERILRSAGSSGPRRPRAA
ncbi:MAG TPA: DUF559 domain-containing protein [Thermoleophilaceae bacterium]|nr:DUF559 domain-containing protein [Thermoleophilaceae bacterium]